MSEQLWSLYNSKTGEQYPDMALANVQSLASLWSVEEARNWLAWQAGWHDWKPVLDCEVANYIPKPSVAPMPPQTTQLASAPPVAAPSAGLAPGPPPVNGGPPPITAPVAPPQESFVDRRKYKRHELELRVILTLKSGKCFRTFTEDVSLGGLKLKHKLPADFSTDDCEIYIAGPDKKDSIKFVGRIVGEPTNPYRIKFTEENELFQKKLQSWIDMISKQSAA